MSKVGKSILILGGAGFLGQKLLRQLFADGAWCGHPIASVTSADMTALPIDFPNVAEIVQHVGNVADEDFISNVFQKHYDVVYLLASVVSGQAELEFDVGYRTNLYGGIKILDAIRAQASDTKLIFTSSLAVFGGEVPDGPILDHYQCNPQTSYGSQKAMMELLINDYSRKGYFDGCSLRLPTVTIRPGKPNAAASGFASGLFREPLQGVETVCPVSTHLAMWVSAPRTIITNLIHAGKVSADDWGMQRAIALPGISVSIEEMISSMKRVAGEEPVNRITYKVDPFVENLVRGWPAKVLPEKAIRLGFAQDRSFDDNIRWFMEDDKA